MIRKGVSLDDIRALRDAAGSAGDLEQVKICERALKGSQRHRDRRIRHPCHHAAAFHFLYLASHPQ